MSKCVFLTLYHILLAKTGELPIEFYALKLTMDFQQRHVHQSLSLIASKATSLSWHIAQINSSTKDDNPTTSKMTYDGSKKAFLAKEWNTFHLSWKKLGYLQCKDFLEYECGLYLRQPLTLPRCKIIVAYRNSNHKLAIEIGQWMTVLISGDTRLCQFCSYNAGQLFDMGIPSWNNVILENILWMREKQLKITKSRWFYRWHGCNYIHLKKT